MPDSYISKMLLSDSISLSQINRFRTSSLERHFDVQIAATGKIVWVEKKDVSPYYGSSQIKKALSAVDSRQRRFTLRNAGRQKGFREKAEPLPRDPEKRPRRGESVGALGVESDQKHGITCYKHLSVLKASRVEVSVINKTHYIKFERFCGT